MGEEVIADHEDEEDPVIDGELEIKREGKVGASEGHFEVLAEDGDIQEDEVGAVLKCSVDFGRLIRPIETEFLKNGTVGCSVIQGSTLMTCLLFCLVEHVFTKYAEMRFMSGERQHYQISILE